MNPSPRSTSLSPQSSKQRTQLYHSDPIPQSPTRPSTQEHFQVPPPPSSPAPSRGSLDNYHSPDSPSSRTRHGKQDSLPMPLPRTFSSPLPTDKSLQFNTSEIERSFQALLKKQPVATPGPAVLQGKSLRHLHPKDGNRGQLLSPHTAGAPVLAKSPVSNSLSHSPIFGSPAAEHARHWIKSVNHGRDHISDSEGEQQRGESDHDSYEDSQQQQWQMDYDHHVAGHVELETEESTLNRAKPASSWTGNAHPMFSMADPMGSKEQGIYPGLISPIPRPSVRIKDQYAIHPLSPVPPSPVSGNSTPKIPQSRSPEMRPQVVIHPSDMSVSFDLGSIPPLTPTTANQPLPPLPPLPGPPPNAKSSRLSGDHPRTRTKLSKGVAAPPKVKSIPVTIKPNPLQEKKPVSLTNPPRKCIHHGKILQVINTSTVKDRYLFLFSDLLLIAKPMSDGHPTIDSRFQVKDVIELKKISLSLSRDKYDNKNGQPGQPGNRKIPPILAEFIHTFDQNPTRALNTFIQKRALHPDPVSVAHLLFKTPEVSKTQLALFLSNLANRYVYKAFLDQCQFAGVLLDEALRTLLSRLSLPERERSQRGVSERGLNGVDYLLEEFTKRWYEANANVVVFDASIAQKLVIAMIVLNAQLHNNEGASLVKDREEVGILVRPRIGSQPSTPTIPSTPVMESSLAAPTLAVQQYMAMELDDLTAFPTPTKESFLEAFQLLDQQRIVSRDTLYTIFLSISHQPLDIELEKLDSARNNAESKPVANRKLWPIMISPAVLPPRLTLKIPSDPITITIPVLNPHFSVHLGGRDLKCEPSVLEFGSHRSQRFRITGSIPGRKTLTIQPRLMTDKGTPEQYYDLQSLPSKHSIAIERQFMRHTFQISLLNDLGTRRRYLFGASSGAEKDEWAEVLTECLLVAKGRNATRLNEHTGLEQSIGLQLLKELLLGVEASDEDEVVPVPQNTAPADMLPLPIPGVTQPMGLGIPMDNHPIKSVASHSSVVASAITVANGLQSPTLGGGIGGLGNEWSSPGGPTNATSTSPKDTWMCKMPKPGTAIPDRLGWELVKLVEQNSLMALMLGFMGALGRDRLRRLEAVRRAKEEEERQEEEEEEEEDDEYEYEAEYDEDYDTEAIYEEDEEVDEHEEREARFLDLDRGQNGFQQGEVTENGPDAGPRQHDIEVILESEENGLENGLHSELAKEGDDEGDLEEGVVSAVSGRVGLRKVRGKEIWWTQ